MDISTDESITMHLDAEHLLHLADAVKGLSAAMCRSDIPQNPFEFGKTVAGPRYIFNIRIPELLLRAALQVTDGSADCITGLGLRISDIVSGMIMGPEDYRFTTQAWIGK